MSQASMCLTDTGQIVNLVTNDVKKTEEVRISIEESLLCNKSIFTLFYNKILQG
jgi:hypothetical protein